MSKNWGSYSQRKSLFNNLLHCALKVSEQNTDPVRLVAKIEPKVQSYLASANFSEDLSANRKRSMILRAAGKEQSDRKRRRYPDPATCCAPLTAFARSLGSTKFCAPATDFGPSKSQEPTFPLLQRQNLLGVEALSLAAGAWL
jgi:hypothetical protein